MKVDLRDAPLSVDEAMDALARDTLDAPDSYDAFVPAAMAVAADPASVPARFVAACTLAKRGLHDLARDVLDVLRTAPRCPACADALVEAQRDTCGFDATTQAAIAAARPGATRTAAEAVLASLNSGDLASIERYLDGDAIRIESACSVCTELTSSADHRSAAGFRAFVREATRRFEAGPYTHLRPVFLFCDDRCCAGPTGMLSHTAIFVTSVCFRGPRDAPKLASIDVIDGG